jgi:hypothetical protein
MSLTWLDWRPRYIWPRHQTPEWEYEAELCHRRNWIFREECPWIHRIRSVGNSAAALPTAMVARVQVSVWPQPWIDRVPMVVPEWYSLIGVSEDIPTVDGNFDWDDVQQSLRHALTSVHMRVWHQPSAMRSAQYVSEFYFIRVRTPGSAEAQIHRVHAWMQLRRILEWAERILPHWQGLLRLVCHEVYVYDSLDYSLFSAAVDPGSLVDCQMRHVPGRSEQHMVRV